MISFSCLLINGMIFSADVQCVHLPFPLLTAFYFLLSCTTVVPRTVFFLSLSFLLCPCVCGKYFQYPYMLQGQPSSIVYSNAAAQGAGFGTTPTGYGYGSWTAVYNSTAAPALPPNSDPALTPNGNIGGGEFLLPLPPHQCS